MRAPFPELPPESSDLPFSTPDLLQLACEGGYGLELVVNASAVQGTIAVWKGSVWSARDLHGEGELAFRRIVEASLGESGVRVGVREVDAPAGPRNVTEDWRALLMDTAKSLDEARAGYVPSPVLEAVLEAELPDEFDACLEAGVAAVLERRYADALALYLRARDLRPDDRVVQANLRRLHELNAAAVATAPTPVLTLAP